MVGDVRLRNGAKAPSDWLKVHVVGALIFAAVSVRWCNKKGERRGNNVHDLCRN